MTDISKKAVEVRIKSINGLIYHIQVPAMPDSVDVAGLEETALMLRALSARVEELEAEKHEHRGVIESSFKVGLKHGRLQGLDEAIGVCDAFQNHGVTHYGPEPFQIVKAHVEALKQEQSQ